MKQTVVQINEATSIYHDTGVGRVGTSILRSPTTVRATGHEGHEGHIMPMPPKPPAVKPVKEKIKPKTPPTPPVAKPPAKKAQSRLRAVRSHRGRRCAPTSFAYDFAVLENGRPAQ